MLETKDDRRSTLWTMESCVRERQKCDFGILNFEERSCCVPQISIRQFDLALLFPRTASQPPDASPAFRIDSEVATRLSTRFRGFFSTYLEVGTGTGIKESLRDIVRTFLHALLTRIMPVLNQSIRYRVRSPGARSSPDSTSGILYHCWWNLLP